MSKSAYTPLADRVRPRTLDEIVGQQHLIGEGRSLSRLLTRGQVHSMILWGPPGTGKTTIARMISVYADAEFVVLSAVMAGVKDVRAAVAEASELREREGRKTLLFLDEVHRFNKAQQDAFLPYIENGTIVFIGATTENPAFELNNALLSRAQVLLLKSLSIDDLQALYTSLADRLPAEDPVRALRLSEEQVTLLARAADGDARRFLNLVEMSADLADEAGLINESLLDDVLSGSHARFDKGGDVFYDQISALHKAVRGSAPDAALYWLQRMLSAGCDPHYIARRVVRMASEDIGNADPRALSISIDAWQALERLGSPEGELMLAQAVMFLACAAKSNAVYNAFKASREDVLSHGSDEVPAHLRNAPTKLAKSLGHGERYVYPHDQPEGYAAGAAYFPAAIGRKKYYYPSSRGLEIKIGEKLEHLAALDRAAKTKPSQN